MAAQRVHYLDALRAFCMLYGVLFRAEMVVPGLVAAEMIAEASGLFRMATFFLISGYFAAMLMTRRGSAGFLKARVVAVGVPAVVCLLLLNPPTSYLKEAFLQGWIDPASFVEGVFGPDYDWFLHLWFLFALVVYVLAAPPLAWAMRAAHLGPAIGWLDQRLGWGLFPLLALAGGAGVVAGRGFSSVVLVPALPAHLAEVTLLTFHYAPFFALGFLAHGCQPLFERLHTVPVVTGAAVGGLWLLVAGTDGQGGSMAEEALYYFARGATNICLIGTLLVVFRRLVSGPSRIVSRLTGAVYSIYLFHYLAIIAIALLIRPYIENAYALFATTIVLTFIITYALHELVIARVPVLRFLFNGRPPSSPPPAAGR